MIGLKNLIKDSTNDIRSKIDSIRLEIESHRQRIDDLENGLLPKADCLDRFNAWIDYQASLFTSHEVLGNFFLAGEFNPSNSNLEINSKTHLFPAGQGEGAYMAAMSATTTNFTPQQCFFYGEQLKSKFNEFIDQLDIPDDCPALSERPRMIQALNTKIRKLATQEEALIVEAENEGIDIARHPSADPRVILEYQD